MRISDWSSDVCSSDLVAWQGRTRTWSKVRHQGLPRSPGRRRFAPPLHPRTAGRCLARSPEVRQYDHERSGRPRVGNEGAEADLRDANKLIGSSDYGNDVFITVHFTDLAGATAAPRG